MGNATAIAFQSQSSSSKAAIGIHQEAQVQDTCMGCRAGKLQVAANELLGEAAKFAGNETQFQRIYEGQRTVAVEMQEEANRLCDHLADRGRCLTAKSTQPIILVGNEKTLARLLAERRSVRENPPGHLLKERL